MQPLKLEYLKTTSNKTDWERVANKSKAVFFRNIANTVQSRR
jgi:hypothetical protein